jgi:hypothetical protein
MVMTILGCIRGGFEGCKERVYQVTAVGNKKSEFVRGANWTTAVHKNESFRETRVLGDGW